MVFTPKTSTEFSVFGLNDVAIKKYGTADTWVDIPGVTTATYKHTVSEVEQTGDDDVIDYWRYGAKGQIVVKASKIAMKALERVTSPGDSGSNVVSTASYQAISFGKDAEYIPPYLCVRGLVKGRSAGENCWMVIYWFKTVVKTAFEAFPEGAYGKLTELTLTFDTLQSDKDDAGAALVGDNQCFGRMEIWTAAPPSITYV